MTFQRAKVWNGVMLEVFPLPLLQPWKAAEHASTVSSAAPAERSRPERMADDGRGT
jgi:hypothetical protein